MFQCRKKILNRQHLYCLFWIVSTHSLFIQIIFRHLISSIFDFKICRIRVESINVCKIDIRFDFTSKLIMCINYKNRFWFSIRTNILKLSFFFVYNIKILSQYIDNRVIIKFHINSHHMTKINVNFNINFNISMFEFIVIIHKSNIIKI